MRHHYSEPWFTSVLVLKVAGTQSLRTAWTFQGNLSYITETLSPKKPNQNKTEPTVTKWEASHPTGPLRLQTTLTHSVSLVPAWFSAQSKYSINTC